MFLKNVFSLLTIILLGLPLTVFATELENPLGTTDLRLVAGNIVKAVLALSGTAALVMFVWGGAQWILSEGSKEKIAKGQKTIVWAVLGLLFIFIAYALLYALLSALGSATE